MSDGSPNREITILCPSCNKHLVTNALAPKLAWCTNRDCLMFIHRHPAVDLVFHLSKESFHEEFWEILTEKEKASFSPTIRESQILCENETRKK